MLLFTEDAVRRTLTMPQAIACMKDVFQALAAGTAMNQPRRRLMLPTGAVLHQLAGAYGNYFGAKIYSSSRQGAWFLVHLYSAETGAPLAMFEANWLGQIRTGAASGYATDLLAPADARTVGLIGTGFQARSQLEAILAVRKIERALIWGRNPEKRRRFAESFGGPVREAASAEEAIRGADIVITATFAKDPVLESAWVKPGAHINAIGSNQAKRRELPSGLVQACSLIVTDSIEQARIESGDLLLALDEQGWNRVRELKDVTAPGAPGGTTLFKSNGLGVQDVAVAAWIYEHARELAREVPVYS